MKRRRRRGIRRKYRAEGGGGGAEREGVIRRGEGRKNFQVRHPSYVEMLKL